MLYLCLLARGDGRESIKLLLDNLNGPSYAVDYETHFILPRQIRLFQPVEHEFGFFQSSSNTKQNINIQLGPECS